MTSTKLRPALVLHEGERDVVVAFISSRTANRTAVDVLIREDNSEFKKTGLKLSSAIRLDKIATISKNLVLGEIGEIGPS
jgi:mRNA interferase MazF